MRLKRLTSLFIFQLPLQIIIGYWIDFQYFTPLTCFIFIPLLDGIIGDLEHIPPVTQDRFFDSLLYLWIPIEIALILWGASVVTEETLSIGERLAFVISIALLSGSGIIVAHELGHRQNAIDRWLAKLLLAFVGYMHFFIEHNQGHHRHAATAKDPASAIKGMSFFEFYPRCVKGSFLSAWEIEKRRLQKNHYSLVSVHNQMLWFIAIPLLMAIGFAMVFGWGGMVYFIVQGVLGFSTLEVINYLQHYGLERRKINSEQYESIHWQHSWSTNSFLSNAYMVQLGKHADHHVHIARPYQTLEHSKSSPQLPYGYPLMTILVCFPPLWFKIMDPILDDFNRS